MDHAPPRPAAPRVHLKCLLFVADGFAADDGVVKIQDRELLLSGVRPTPVRPAPLIRQGLNRVDHRLRVLSGTLSMNSPQPVLTHSHLTGGCPHLLPLGCLINENVWGGVGWGGRVGWGGGGGVGWGWGVVCVCVCVRACACLESLDAKKPRQGRPQKS